MSEHSTVQDLAAPAFTDAISHNAVSVIEFYAPWCTPCEKMQPILAEIAEEIGDKAHFYRMNADDCGALVQKLRLITLPTTILFYAGKELERTTGAKAKFTLRALIEQVIENELG